MADHHHHQHRPHRLSVPSRMTSFSGTSRPYSMHPYTSSTPTPTPSKHRLSSFSSFNSKSSGKSSLSFLLLLLFSLRSFYSLLPFLRSSPSFSLFPFSFLVSLLSFLLTLSFSLFSLYYPSSSSKDPFYQNKLNNPIFGLTLITQSQQSLLFAKSVLLALVFLLRFQALRYCGTAAMILAELTGSVAARFVAERRNQNRTRSPKVRGFLTLSIGLFLLSFSWDRVECFPFSTSSANKWIYGVFARENCVRIWPMLLPFLSGFLACYERKSMDWGTIKQLGHKRVRLITLLFTTIVLFVPAVISFLLFEAKEESVSFGNLAWPLVNTVVFGVLLSENYSDEKLVSSKDSKREFVVTFICTVVLELFYYPELSLWGLLLCGFLLYIAVRDLDPLLSKYESGDGYSESFTSMIMKPIRHILSERKSRKIALFLLINTGYMVVEFVGGFMSNSLGLISDACHMLFDCAALAIGLYASYISRLPANNQYNYGRGRFEVLSGYANAVFLVLVGALIVLESFERILDPQEVSTNSLLVVSIGGLVVNVIGLIFFHEEHHLAHGGSGSCSHSHSKFHSHHDHHHHYQDQHCHVKHNNEGHGKHENVISVSSDCQERSCSHSHGQNLHHHNHCSHHVKADCQAEDHITQIAKHHDHHDHPWHHDNHVHAQQHVHHDHGDHHDHDNQQHHHHNHGGVRHHDHDHDSRHHHHDADHHCHGGGVCSSTRNCDSQLKNTSIDGAKKPQEHSHFHIDHNMEGIFLHVLADTMGSVGVVISTLLIQYKGWLVADPACSIFISVLIISSVIPLLRNSAEILLQRVPRMHEKELKDALNDVLKIRGVYGIQRFHIWSLTNTDVVGTLHLHVSTDAGKTSVKSQVSHVLHNAGVKDLTLQVECVGQ